MPPIPKTFEKNEHYEILNLIGYGLAKFDIDLVLQFGFRTKSAFFKFFVDNDVAKTVGTVKNRQDLFDPLFPQSKRKGWWQHHERYQHRKDFIDSQFGDLGVSAYAEVIKLYLQDKLHFSSGLKIGASPLTRSRYKQLQLTGLEAEQFFLRHYEDIEVLKGGRIEDARLFGDGYDFQIELPPRFVLADVKGLQINKGAIRLTDREFRTAEEYGSDYAIVVVSNLSQIPRMSFVPDPAHQLKLHRRTTMMETIAYHSESFVW